MDTSGRETVNGTSSWRKLARRRQASRALARQLAYQEEKSRHAKGHEREYEAAMLRHSKRVRDRIETKHQIADDARVLEIGSGAHGLIFYFGTSRGVGVDPLAAYYVSLFPAWQRRALTVAALGEELPFAAGSFDVVLCDNVVDHAEDPGRIVREIARVLAPGGLVYFTVNVHHPVYAVAAAAHATWNAAGLRFEIGPFADHTVHLTLDNARKLFEALPLRVVSETDSIDESKEQARRRPPRHMGDRLKRVFFKNALYEVIAIRD